MELNQNFFELFQIPPSFAVDETQLQARYREAQQVIHPDRFAGGTDQERRLAMQMAAHVNEGYQTLSDPILRARYLLLLNGIDLEHEPNRVDPEFLEQQMELREALVDIKDQADPFPKIDELKKLVGEHLNQSMLEIETLFEQGDEVKDDLVEQVRRLQFISKFKRELSELENRMLDEL